MIFASENDSPHLSHSTFSIQYIAHTQCEFNFAFISITQPVVYLHRIAYITVKNDT